VEDEEGWRFEVRGGEAGGRGKFEDRGGKVRGGRLEG